ncbi:TPA: SDR family oxidoreductase [Enterobacter cloacae]|nr:SDR family oxidoreductase [Enterobacter cloacae]
MTDNKVILAVNNGDGKTRLLTADAGRTVKVKLIPGNKYLLKNINDDFAPENITLQRVDKALHIIQEGDTQPSIIIEDYFNGDPNNPVLMGMAEDGLLYAYVPLSGESYDTGYLMADGSMSPVALGGEPLGAGGPLLTAPDDDNDMLFGMLGWFALAAAGVGAAFALSEMDKDDGDNHSTPDKPSIGTTMDDEGSIKGPLKSGDTTDDSTPTLTGKGKPGDTIHIYDNDKEIGSVIVDDEGEWSYTPDKPLGEGEHELTVVEKDPDGNASPPSDPIVIVVDTVAPKAPTIEHIMDKVGKTTGEIHDDAYTDDPQPEMSGTGEAGATIAIYDNGKKIGETTVNDDGRWYFKPSENLTDGSHSITVSQTDKAGNVSEPSDERDFIVLTEPPGKAETPEVIDNTGPVTGPLKPGDVTDDSQPSFSGEGTPGNTIIIKDNDKEIGSVIVDDEGKWSFTPKDELAEGEHNVVVVEEDPLGNEGDPSDPIQIIVDTTPPAKPDMADALDNTGPITGQLKGGDVTDETRPVFSGKGEPGDTVTIYDGDEVLGTTVIDDKGNWTLKPEKPLGEGDHSITVTQTDKAGNTSDPSEALEFEVDTTAPDASANVLNITAVADDVGDRQGNVASGDITDDSKPLISGIGEAGNTVFVYTTDSSGKHLIGTAVVGSDGTWSLTPETPLTEGLNKLTLETQDPAGNRVAGEAPSYDINLLIPVSTAPSINSVVDNAEPHVGPMQKGESTNDTTPTLSGSAAPGDIVSILDNGKVIGTVTADSNGKWAFTPDTALADGKHTFTVTATDAAGNARTSGSFPIVIDTAAPSPAENIVINDNVGDKQGPVGPGDTTDDQSPTLSGEAEPGSVVDIYDNDEKIGSVIVDDEGKWSYTPDTPLAKGDHEITTTVTDPSGNTSEPSPGISFTVDPDPNQVTVGEVVDDEGPIVGNLKPGTVTDDARPELSGKGKPGSTVTIMDGDDVLGSTVVDPDGNWTFTPEQDLADGDHSLTVISKDPAGNEVTSPSFDITVDATAPEKPVLGSATDDVGTIRGDLSNGGTTDDANPTFNGSAEPGSRVDIYDNGEHIGSTIADDNGAWQFTPTTPLPEGEHHITTTATDEAGNTGPESDDFVLVTDYTPPVASSDVLNITSVMDDVGGRQGNVASGEITDDSKPVINGIGEAGSTVFVYSTDANGKHLLGSAVVNSEGTWTLALDTPLVEGLNQLTLETQDAVGNRVVGEAPSYDITVLIPVSTEPSINSVVDNAEPHVGPMQKGETTNDTTPTLSGSAAPGDIVSILDNGKVIGTVKADSSGKWSFTPDTALADGQHTFTVTATDAAGNARTSGSFPIVIDTAAPSPAENIVINDNVGDKQGPVGPGDTTDDQSPTLSGEAEPGSVVDTGSVTGSLSQGALTDDTRPQISGTAKAGSTVTIMDGSNVLGTTTAGADGTWSFTPSVDLGRGDHTFTATAKDPMGNESSSSSWTVTIDTDAPVKPTIDAALDDVGSVQGNLANGGTTDDPTPTLSGKAEAGSTVKIYDQNGLLGEVTAKADGTWSFSPVAKLPEGEHRFHVTATDKAGNTSVASDDFVLTLDFTAPDASKVSITDVVDDFGSVTGSIASGGKTDDNTPLIKGTGAEPGNTITVYNGDKVIGTAKVQADGTWELQVTKALPDGTYNLTVKETDSVGNTTAASPEYIIQIDAGGQPLPPTLSSVEDDVAPHTGPLQKDATTNDNTLLLTGTAEAGVTVRIYGGPNGTTLLGETKADAQGKWSFNTPKLADGVHTFVAEAINDIGQVSPQTGGFPITVDTSAPGEVTGFIVSDNEGPKTGTLSNGDTTDDATPTISGKAEPGSVVHIYVNGQENGTAVADVNGNWTYTTGSLVDGEYTFTARAEDSAGNLGAENAGVTVTLDTSSVPVTIVRVMDDKGSVTGELKANDVTDDARPEISGKAKAGSTVTIMDGNVVLGSVKADASGNWVFTPTSDLGDGVHNITATAKDLTGKEDTSSTFSFEIDSKAPNRPSIDYAEDQVGTVKDDLNSNDVTDDPQPILHGTAEAGSTVNIYTVDGTLLGSVTANSNGAWNFKPGSKLPEGKNTFYVTATDEAGNVSDKSADFILTTDYTAPDASKVAITEVIDNYGSVTGKVESGGVLDDSRPVIKGTGAEIGNVITVYTTDASGATKVLGTTKVDANGTWTLTVSDALYADLNKLTVTETDTTGNTAKPSTSYDVTLSSAPGMPVIDGITDDAGSANVELSNGGLTKDTTPTLHGTASGVAGNTVTIYNGSQVVGTTTLDANGHWSFTPGTALADGSYHFTVTVTNTAGQESEKSQVYSIDVDATAPNPATDILIADDVSPITGNLQDGDVTDDNKPTFSGKAEAGSTVNILDGGKVIGSTTVDSNGNWDWTPGTALADGDHAFTTTVTDKAGNTSAPTGVVNITVDTQGSTVALSIDGYHDDVGTNTGLILGSGTSTDDTSPILQGSWSGDLETTESIRVYQDGILLGLAVLDRANHTWTMAVNGLVNANTYKFTVVAVDAAGNESAPSAEFALTIDQDAPTQTVSITSYTDDVGLVTGNMPGNTSTDDRQPVLNGKVTGTPLEAGDEVRIYDVSSNTMRGTATVNSDGTWSFELPPLDDNMTHTFRAVVADNVGNEGTPSSDFAITVDLNLLVNKQDTLDTTPIVSGSTGFEIQQGEYVEVTVNGKTYSSQNGQVVVDMRNNTWYVQIPDADALNVGTYDVKAVLFDAAGVQIAADDSSNELVVSPTPKVGAFTNAPQSGEFAGDANTDDSANTWSWYGGIVAIDKNGDGYVDMINGDQTPNDSAIRGGYGSQIVLNNDGTVVGMSKDGTFATDYAADSGYDPIGLDQSQPDMELSGVDINNDGIVDFVMHSQNIVSDGSRIDANGATDSSAARSTNQARLVVVNGTNNGNWKVTQIVDNVFQRGSDSDPDIGNGVAMTWGDYNGDGYLDLFLGRGSESTTSDSSAGNNAGEYASRIHFNDGNGKLLSDDGDNNGIGNPTGMYTFNDTLAGGASLALDWNHDGKMDVIELPGMESSSGGINDAAATGPINLYTNTSVNGNTSFTTSNLLTQVGKSTIGGSSTAQQVTGAIAIDVDWDGDRDLLAFTSGGTTTYIENKNEVAHGTSIHLRILDEGGINTLFGNTVQLIDEATGQVVSTQIINAQSGNQTNDSTAIVDFYNLDATKSYSAVILRSTGGAVSNVGGVATVDGKAVQNVNKAWGGLTAAEGNHAYVLTTESENNVANASASGGTNTTGIVGTGYNDTFFATLGNDLYNGAGGTETVSGVKSWNNTGGLDIVDYKLAGSTPLNIDLNKTGMQNTGFGSAQFVNVEGLAGGSGNDTFTGNAANNYFEGRAGADTFYLDNDGKGGGQDTLKYQVQENGRTNGTGGNGSDVVHGFVVGTVEATRKADIIDISSLLVGYAGDADGAAHYINGVATIDAGDAIAQYLSVTYNGKDTILSIDRDGSGSGFGASQVLTIADTKVDLETLLANHQLVIKGPDVSTMNYSALNEGVTVNMWTGFTSAGGKLEDIVKIVGTQTDDTITDNSFSNVIAGEGGNDTFYLMNGGNDVLMYNVLEGMENDATGGNGHDTVHGFKVGNVEKDGDADTLNLSDLVDYSGPVTFFENNGKMELDAESKGLEDYLKVDVVNAIAPGMIESKMVKKVSRTVVRGVTASIPLRRLGKCDEVANTVVYLGSTASSYIVGQTIVIDGGLVMR